MKKLICTFLFVGAFIIWLFWSDYTISEQSRPIKKITEITGLHLFGLKRIYTVWKYEEIYNPKGQLIEWCTFDGDCCTSKDVYEYNTANLQTRKLSFSGNQLLHPYKIEEFLYDSLNRSTATLLYEINKIHPDTFLYDRTSYYYDSLNRKYKTIIEHFSDLYPDKNGSSTFIDYFDANNLVASTIYMFSNDTSITKNYYTKKNLIATVGGLLDDSIVYTRNSDCKIIKEQKFYKGTISSTEENWYDASGNKIKTYSDIESGSVYEYKYDSKNRLVKETRSGRFAFFFKGVVTHEYEFY